MVLKTEPLEGAKKPALCHFSVFWAGVQWGTVGRQVRKQLLPSSQSTGSRKKVERKDISLLWLRKYW